MKIPQTEVSVEYTKFIGGLDQETPYLTFPSGAILNSKNYLPATEGGYRRIGGYERFDGRSAPSDAEYVSLAVTFSASVAVGNTITGVTSTATGVISNYSTTKINVTKVSGTFQSGETLNISGSPVAVVTAVNYGEDTIYDDAVALNAAADIYRADIGKPAGTTAVRGVCAMDGIVYAFVDNALDTAGEIYKSTSSGWSAISLGYELSFDSGTGLIEDGDSITQLTSGATADVLRVVVTSGDWGTDAAGKLIITNIVGTFDATHDLQVSSATQATSTSLATAITITKGGRYEFTLYNFSSDVNNRRIYGCDGVNRGFEFDGTVYVPIDVPLDSADTPAHVNAHKQQLFFHYNSGVIHSGVGRPYEFTAISGANALSLGDVITGSCPLPGQALAIFARNESSQLIGNNIDDYKLDNISNEVGAIPYTIQRLGNVFCLDDRGIIMITATDFYGNFTENTISRKIQPFIKQIRQVVTASGVNKTYGQYRIYGNDGTGLCMTKVGDEYHFALFEYANNVSCVFCGEDSDGSDVSYFGTDDGWIMQEDKGSSFDGEDIEAFFSLPFNNSQAPTTLKTYRKGTIEMSCLSYTTLKLTTSLSYGSTYLAENPVEEENVEGPGGIWDVSNWDEVAYDKELIVSPTIQLKGTGLNMSLTVYSKSQIDLGHKLDGIIVHYTPRRLVR